MSLLDALLDLEKRPYVRRYDPESYDLSGFRAWVDELGAPDRALPILHIAGTKGKGSTAAFAEAVLRAHGHRTGMYTSPHLAHFGERFRVGGEPWTLAHFEAALNRFEDRMPDTHRRALREGGAFKTVFEVLTALALVEFAAERCDAVVWETGLGGRLDATNIVTPVASAITRLGLDHTKILGPTIAHIAREKAGIIKSGVPAVFMEPLPEQRADVLAAIAERAAATGAPVCSADAEVAVIEAEENRDGCRARYRFADGAEHAARLPLHGTFQARNAQVALAACAIFRRERGLPFDPAVAVAALEATRWAGRIEVHRRANGGVLVLDGAHCPTSARARRDARAVAGAAASSRGRALCARRRHEHRQGPRRFRARPRGGSRRGAHRFAARVPSRRRTRRSGGAARGSLRRGGRHGAHALELAGSPRRRGGGGARGLRGGDSLLDRADGRGLARRVSVASARGTARASRIGDRSRPS